MRYDTKRLFELWFTEKYAFLEVKLCYIIVLDIIFAKSHIPPLICFSPSALWHAILNAFVTYFSRDRSRCVFSNYFLIFWVADFIFIFRSATRSSNVSLMLVIQGWTDSVLWGALAVHSQMGNSSQLLLALTTV